MKGMLKMAEKTYKMTIDPSILELLGPSLYTNIYYVLAELIANAYDAGAKNVYVIAGPDSITVEDDGVGMTYQEVTEHYLAVAQTSRLTEAEAFSRDGTRRRMGRKGIGKLAALSVSERVLVQTRSGEDVSGFVLARRIMNQELEPIPVERIQFQRITGSGTSVVMLNPEYRLHKTLEVVKKNLSKVFPVASEDFQIHIIRGDEESVLNGFDEHILSELCAIITFGDEYSSYADKVLVGHPNHNQLTERRSVDKQPILLVNNAGVKREYSLEIAGWIGAYQSTRGRKMALTDFPDNHLSIYANGKLGEFNILPIVGQNKMNEVYVVGQLHIDLFELTELPDMALSNRQGYKSDDPRYQAVLSEVRDEILPKILNLRETYADIQNAEKKRIKAERLRADEALLKRAVDNFKQQASRRLTESLGRHHAPLTPESVGAAFDTAINESLPDLGIKTAVDSGKRRILISQTKEDKPIADIVYQMLRYNNVPSEDIIYTNCDDEVSWVPEGRKIYEYLREFFVDSYSTKKIYVLFVTSENTKASWGALTEVGAAWITQIDNKIFNVAGFRPEHPLDDESQWHTTYRNGNSGQDIWMDDINVTLFCRKIEDVCDKLGYARRTREENQRYLRTLVAVR